VNGAPEKPMTPARPASSARDQPDRVHDEGDVVLGLDQPQPLDVGG